MIENVGEVMDLLDSRRNNPAKIWIASLRTSIITFFFVFITSVAPAMARGGHMHGLGGFGLHEGHSGGDGKLATPAFVLITVYKITDAEALKSAIRVVAEDESVAGRVAMDTDKPVYWEGTAAEHVVMIQFENADQAQAWKNSDTFKKFDTELHRSSESTVQILQELPITAGRQGRRGRGVDQKAYDANVKDYDQMLNTKLRSICKGC